MLFVFGCGVSLDLFGIWLETEELRVLRELQECRARWKLPELVLKLENLQDSEVDGSERRRAPRLRPSSPFWQSSLLVIPC